MNTTRILVSKKNYNGEDLGCFAAGKTGSSRTYQMVLTCGADVYRRVAMAGTLKM